MRFRKRQRLILVSIVILLLGGATTLVLTALEDTIAFFVSPSELKAMEVDRDKRLRIGGLVVEDSIERDADGTIRFRLTDMAEEVVVVYAGILPDLFREGQGIVANGRMRDNGVFEANEILAKHDENYMPKEAADALKEAGHWQPDGKAADEGASP